MDWLQFWEWDIWPWLGGIIASQPFLTLMVPATTLTGIVVTTKSNERIRRWDLQTEGKQWRYEVENDNAAVQRQAVRAFLTEVADLDGKISEDFLAEHEPLAEMSGLKDGEYEKELVKLHLKYWGVFRSKVKQHLLTLELSLADEDVRAQASKVGEAFRKDEIKLASPDKEGDTYQSPYSIPFFTSPSPISEDVNKTLEELKRIATERLHPLPSELPVKHPRCPRLWRRN
ncbi:hypothetical protein [Corynebacterium tuscaniense]|uniref:hypothetical protein n=1 Tax=Corynebacterium tuscaniense TaxID=302449 RepID=UPI00123A47F9|nr:hypothetical protein [Corynebacterium tuscaniense]KAA8730679.1 hypothetical protein F4V54_10460 [Corynebacterium tuscaniense]